MDTHGYYREFEKKHTKITIDYRRKEFLFNVTRVCYYLSTAIIVNHVA